MTKRFVIHRSIQAGFVFGLLFAFGFATSAFAAETTTESITMSPVSKNYALDAGSEKTDQFTIINDGKAAYDFIVYSRPYYVDSNSYNPNYTSERANADAYKWVEFAQTKYRLEPNQSVKVNYTLRVPREAAPGGHYGVLFAETQPNPDNSGANSVVRTKRVGAIIYATVNGQYITRGYTSDVVSSFFQFSPPIEASTSATNTGNVDFLANVEFQVKDILGRTVFSETKDYPILPDTTRSIAAKWGDAPMIGLYKVEMNVKALGETKNFSGYVLLAPIWAYGIVIVLVAGGIFYAVARRRS